MIEPIKPLSDAQTDWTFKKVEQINVVPPLFVNKTANMTIVINFLYLFDSVLIALYKFWKTDLPE